MKVIGDFNNVSEAIKPVKLKKGEVVEYFFYSYGMPDWNKPGKINYPFSRKIKTKDRIYDPGKNDPVDVGVFSKKQLDEHRNEVIITKSFYLPGAASGILLCQGGNIDQEEMYEFLELTNDNESNPNRDTSVIPVFRRIDAKKDALKRMSSRSDLQIALTYASGMKEEEIREFAAAMAWNEKEDLEMLQDQLGEFAQTKPSAFIKFWQDPNLKDKALIKSALTKGIISYDVATHRIKWGNTPEGTAIASLLREDGRNHVDLFTEWLRLNGKAGDNVMSGIRKHNNALIKEQTKPAEVTE